MFGGSKPNSPLPNGKAEPGNNPNIQSADSRFSLVELRKIHQQLVENKNVDEENSNLVVEILRVIAEMVVYGDNKSELLFDFFCEKNMLALFLEIMWAEKECPISVHIQILQTLSILISCVKNDTSLYYLLSNNYINEILNFPHDLAADESLGAQYASFMKSLSLRLNTQTVQFFFIEDTGAFPLLTRAIQLLESKDPMIRISAQTTILNIYHVDDTRSREYALQDDVMFQFFEGVTKIMKDQYSTIQRNCIEMVRLNHEKEYKESEFIKIKQNLDDVMISIEDWLYYLQDVIDLNIELLKKSLVSHLLNNFIYSVLLSSLLTTSKNVHHDSVHKAHEEEDDEDKEEAKLLSTSLASAALFYLLQMVKILSNPIMRRAVIVALFHPLSQESREKLLAHVATPNLEGSSFKEFNLDHLNLQHNRYREALFHLLASSDSQKLMLLVTYNIHTAINGWIENPASGDVDDMSIAEMNVKFFEASYVVSETGLEFPSAELQLSEWDSTRSNEEVKPKEDKVEEDSWKKKRHTVSIVRTDSALALNADLLTVNKLTGTNKYISSFLKQQKQIDYKDVTSRLCKILMAPQDVSLSTIQVVVHVLNMVLKAVHTAAKEQRSNQPVNIEKPEERPLYHGFTTMAYFEVTEQLRIASRNAAVVLLSRFDSHSADMLLILINEEIKRFSGRKWKVNLPKMLTDKLLLIPFTNSNKVRMGLDFEIPICQVEVIRKEVQTFLMLRALYKHIIKFSDSYGGCDTDYDVFDLSACINDKEFLVLDEVNLVPDHYQIAGSFEMKGKKFLDVNIALTPEEKAAAAAAAAAAAQSSSSSLSSMLGFGNKKSATPPPTAINNKSKSPVPGSEKGAKDKEKLLFVQDPNLLLLVSQKRVDGKSVFKVHTAAPLLYTDAKIDLNDRHQMTIMIRSWKGVPNFKKLEVDGAEAIDDYESSNKVIKRSETYLKVPERSTMFQLSLVMDTEQACGLAVHHIESRRKALGAIKMEKLKSLLCNWSSDIDIALED